MDTISSKIVNTNNNRVSLINPHKHRLILDTPFLSRRIISYGLMVFAQDTKRWLIIQRKHSIEFILFIRGFYRLTYLPLTLTCITSKEANIIQKCIKEGSNSFKKLFIDELNLPSNELSYALIRFNEAAKIVIKIFNNCDLYKNHLRWTWPKGRINIANDRETPFECALREFNEEVEITLPPHVYISNTYITENIKSISGRNIESRYWIYIIPHEILLTPPSPSHPEVANRLWVTTENCYKMIPHNILFKEVIDMVISLVH